MFGKNKKKVLCVCHFGKNRSKYLANFLKEKGYETKYGGISDEQGNIVKQEDVDWADVIIVVRDVLKQIFLKNFKVKNQKLITLEVIDNPDFLKNNSEFVWEEYQETHTYPEIKRQIKEFLPL